MESSINIIDSFKRVNLNIGCRVFIQSHTEENMSYLLTDVLEEWKVLSKTHVLISDSAANMLSWERFQGFEKEAVRGSSK